MKLVKDTDQLQKKKPQISDEKAEEAIETIIKWIGEDSEREGLLSTPKRVIKAFKEYFKGYQQNPKEFLSKTFTEVEGYDDMVIEKNISIQSHCEHHMAPIIGVVHVAYLPLDKIVGLSKLARVVDAFSKRLQTQERLTMQIAKTIMNVLQPRGLARVVDAFSKRLQTQERLTMQIAKTIMNVLQPRGVAVTIDAVHHCMTNRGVKKENTSTVTNYFLGAFKDDLSFQNRYLRYINKE